MSAAVQTLWARLIARTLADAGVATVAISPGSRSTPLVAALALESRLDCPSIIDERAAAFFALGEARATGRPVALVCTSGSAAAHYLPAIVEAAMAGVPLIAITADRPPELHDCGASQTIDQTRLYGAFVRGAFDLGAPVGDALAFRAQRAKLAQAIALARGPLPGPVHVNVPLRKPLEPAEPSSELERELAALVPAPLAIGAPRLVADAGAIAELAAAIRAEPTGVIVAGALPVGFARDAFATLAQRTGYPVIAEAGSQLRDGSAVHHFDVIAARAPAPRLVIQLGAEPVAASWPSFAPGAQRWVLAETWSDPSATARVVRGDVATAITALADALVEVAPAATTEYAAAWRALDRRAADALAKAMDAAPSSETAVLRAAIGAAPNAVVQIGNSLPIRTIEHAAGALAQPVLTQRGAAGIDGLIASAAGAARTGKPVLLVLGDVSFAHDVGSLQLARAYPVVILVIDNGGGQIFSGLPVAGAGLGDAFAKHFTTAPELDPVAIAGAFGIRGMRVAPDGVAGAVAEAIERRRCAVLHVPCAATGAHDVRRATLAALEGSR